MRGRPHSREFKLSIVRQLASGEKCPAQVCREHNLAASMVARWRQEYDLRGEAAFAPVEPTATEALEAKVAELERFCGQLALKEHRVKKSFAATSVQERHAVIEALQRQEKPVLSVRRLCKMLGVNRRW